MSIVAVAKALKISQPFLHDIEMRNKRPSLDTLAEIAILTDGEVNFVDFLPPKLAEKYAKLPANKMLAKGF